MKLHMLQDLKNCGTPPRVSSILTPQLGRNLKMQDSLKVDIET